MTPDRILEAVIAAADAGRPLTPRDLLKLDPAAVAHLFREELIERSDRRLGGTAVTVIVPTALATFDPDEVPVEGWTANQIAWLKNAYPAGVRFEDMSTELGKPGGQVLMKALSLGLERRGSRERDRKRRRTSAVFADYVPSWRIRRLRILLEECRIRGANPDDDGAGIDHRAARRAFDTGRADLGAASRHNKAWSDRDVALIAELREKGGTLAAIATELRRTVPAVSSKVSALGISQDMSWTDREDAQVVAGIELGMTTREISERLPGRTRLAVKIRARLLAPGRGFPLWTDEESDALVQAYRNGDNIREFARTIGRGVSGCRWRARYLGLVHPAAVRPWTPAEDRILRDGYAAGTPIARIAENLDRPTAGLYNRAFTLGLQHRYSRPWTAEEISRLGDLADQGLTLKQIADALDRKPHAVHKKCKRHGFRTARARTRPETPRHAVSEIHTA